MFMTLPRLQQGGRHDLNRFWQAAPRAFTALFVGECILLLTPLILASLARPFGTWDYFTAPDLYLPYGTTGFLNAVRNYAHNVLKPTATVRPTYAMIINLQYLILGGEFWLWYLVKWALKFACIAGVDTLLRTSKCIGLHVLPLRPCSSFTRSRSN